MVDVRATLLKYAPLTVLGLAFCFLMSYLAEEFFGIADITGAYVAGLVLSNLRDSDDIERRLDVNSYTLFGPLFSAVPLAWAWQPFWLQPGTSRRAS